ncbi:MAG: GumC family protein [Planctomycetota bacterium]|jgi:capsular polysaccharide biosynthesis protein
MNDSKKHQDQVIGQEIITFQPPPEPGSESATHLVAGILRRWYIVLPIFFIVCLVGLLAVWILIEPVYDVRGAIRVAPVLADILSGEADPGEISNYLSFMNTQAEMITSNEVVQRVADNLVDKNLSFFESGLLFSVDLKFQSELNDNIISEELRKEFEQNETSLSQDVTVTVKKKDSKWEIADEPKKYSVRKERLNLNIYEEEGTGFISKLKRKISGIEVERDAANKLKQAIANEAIIVAADRNTELIRVAMKNKNKEEARQIVDAFIDSYMEIGVVSSDEDENRQLNVLENESKLLEVTIKDKREAIYQLGQEYGTTVLESRQEMMLTRVSSLLATLTTVEANRLNLEARVLLLERMKEQTIAPEELLKMRQAYINQDPVVVSFTDNITQLDQELIIARQQLSPTNPEIPRKVELLETLKAHLEERKKEASEAFDELVAKEAADAGRKQLITVRSELEQTREYEKRLQETLSQEDTETIGLGRKQLRIQELQDSLQLTKERYDIVLRRIQDLGLQRKRPTRISVHYYADVADIRDKRVKYSVAIVFVALACGMGLAHLRDRADQSLRTPDDVAKRIGIRIIGTTTSLHTGQTGSSSGTDSRRLPNYSRQLRDAWR